MHNRIDRYTWMTMTALFCYLLCLLICAAALAKQVSTPAEAEKTEIRAVPPPISGKPLSAVASREPAEEAVTVSVMGWVSTPMEGGEATEKAQELEVDKERLEMLACTIYCEAGGDNISDDTRLKVGNVVLNREADSRYPNTMYEVLTQKSQYGRFHWTGIVWPARASNAGEAHAVKRAYEIAERLLLGERVLDSGYIFQSEYKQTNDYIYQDGLYFCK